MNEEKRLKKLKKTRETQQKLTYQDLLLLLDQDEVVREKIRAMPGLASEVVEKTGRVLVRGTADETPALSEPLAADPLRKQLAPELDLLRRVQSDPELQKPLNWLDVEASEGRQLVRLLVRAAQWDEVIRLWEHLADRCKKDQRMASDAERQLLTAVLAVHNQCWSGEHKPSLIHVNPGTPYHYEQHQSGNATGDTIRAEWLPGLRNAGGSVVKKPLVET